MKEQKHTHPASRPSTLLTMLTLGPSSFPPTAAAFPPPSPPSPPSKALSSNSYPEAAAAAAAPRMPCFGLTMQCFDSVDIALTTVALEGRLSWKRSPPSSTMSAPWLVASWKTSSKAANESCLRISSFSQAPRWLSEEMRMRKTVSSGSLGAAAASLLILVWLVFVSRGRQTRGREA